MEVDRNGMEVLDRATCLALAAGEPIGRLGLTVGALPVILPVSFALVGGDVVMTAGEGTKLRAAVREEVACFEVDGVDTVTRTGWSVLLTGRLREVVHPAELAAARALPLDRWLPSGGGRYVRLHPQLVSGRRVLPAGRRDGAVVAATG